MQNIYSEIKEVSGNGLLIIGGFDQVASLISNSKIEFAYLIDKNALAVEYARLRLALTQISCNVKDYLSRLSSREINSSSNNIVDLVECLKIQLRNGQEFDIDLAVDTYEKLCKYEIHQGIIEQTIYDSRFANRLMGDIFYQHNIFGGNYLATRRLIDFVKQNEDNWLSNNDFYEKIKKMYKEEKIKFIWGNLAFADLLKIKTCSFFYTSNVQEYYRNLDFYRKKLLQIAKNDAVWLWTSTNTQGKGNIEKIHLNI